MQPDYAVQGLQRATVAALCLKLVRNQNRDELGCPLSRSSDDRLWRNEWIRLRVQSEALARIPEHLKARKIKTSMCQHERRGQPHAERKQ